MATMDYETENGRYEGKNPTTCPFLLRPSRRAYVSSYLYYRNIDEPRYERDRSASPRPVKRDDDYGKRDDTYRGGRDRSASPNDRMDSRLVHSKASMFNQI